ncbi:uncharacterized protein LOC131948794 [Physella acuta]|uniref:uncharacterized protein LOC131948794 n=1 Tax=Physella acuta TaxID=109671 RepID=UPI0027DE11B1|nr:uncharacterized protein LOC131948794 [Physella acuta]
MCSPLQKKALAPYIKSLEDQRNVLLPMLDTTSKAIDECNLWIKEKDGSQKTFLEMMQKLEEINNINFQIYTSFLKKSHNDADELTQTDISTPTSPGGANYPDVFQSIKPTNKYELNDAKTESLERKYQKLEEDFKLLNEKQKCFEIKQNSQIKKSKSHGKQIDELEANVKTLNERMDAQTKLTTTQSDTTNQITESMKEVKKCCTINEKRMHETEKNHQILLNKLNRSEASIKAISEKDLKFSSQLENYENKNMNLEKKFEALCQVIAKRYNAMDSVKQVINKLTLSRDKAYLKLNDKISTLEETMKRSPIGFAAQLGYEVMHPSGEVIKDFSNVLFNNGDHFDPNTGEFTAPADGVYCVSLMITGYFDTDDNVQIIVRVPTGEQTKESNDESNDQVSPGSNGSQTNTDDDNETEFQRLTIQQGYLSCVANVSLYAGYKVLLRFISRDANDKKDFLIFFCCYKINNGDD